MADGSALPPVSPPNEIDFSRLTPRQREVLGWIAINQDGGHHPRVLKFLLDKGLIERHEVRNPFERLPFYGIHYTVPLPVHIQWCAWCAAQEGDGDGR